MNSSSGYSVADESSAGGRCSRHRGLADAVFGLGFGLDKAADIDDEGVPMRLKRGTGRGAAVVAISAVVFSGVAVAAGGTSVRIEGARYGASTGLVTYRLVGSAPRGGVLSGFLSASRCASSFTKEDDRHGQERLPGDRLLGKHAHFSLRESHYAIPAKQNHICEYLTAGGVKTLSHASATVEDSAVH